MMFSPHLAEIEIRRDDPGQKFDANRESLAIAKANLVLAEHIVSAAILKKPVERKKKETAEAKIRKMIEFDARFKSVRTFMETWNKWRDFYFDLGPIQPKNGTQLTVIEDAITFAKEHRMNLSILLACVHKAWVGRNFKPNFHAVILHGEEYYDKYHDKVLADIDKRSYEERALS